MTSSYVLTPPCTSNSSDVHDQPIMLQVRNSISSYVEEWNVTWGDGSNEDWAQRVAILNDSIYLAGLTYSMGVNGHGFLVKYASNGTQLWNRTWGGSMEGYCDGCMTYNNSIYLFGTRVGPGTDAFLVKYAPNGTELWNRTWNAGSSENGKAAVGYNGSIYFTGRVGSEAFLVKYDQAGNELWNRTWGHPAGSERPEGIAVTNDSIYVSGTRDGFGDGSYNPYLVKFNATGYEVWNETWGGPDEDWARDLAIDSSHKNLYVVGQSDTSGSYDFEAFLVKYTENGTQLWNRTWRGTDTENIASDVVVFNNSIFTVGTLDNPGAGGRDVFLATFAANGTQLWNMTWDASINVYGKGLAVENNSIFVGGNDFNEDAFLVRLDTDSDNDGLGYYAEINIHGTDPNNPDSDADNITDGWEVFNTLDPLNVTDAALDFDGDGLTNLEEFNLDTNPNLGDTDGDLMPDLWEATNGLNPRVNDSNGDLDSDLLLNLLEYQNNADPNLNDTDDDGILDWNEVFTWLTEPDDADTDGDGLIDGDETSRYSTNPILTDTDGDGYSDGEEVSSGTNPLDPASNPHTLFITNVGAAASVMVTICGAVLEIFAFQYNWSNKKAKIPGLLLTIAGATMAVIFFLL